ncbi:heat shock factor-binding protein 1-like protein 1 isoform 1 [Corchorus capsularis]|uniref:Heat shock factor-binding protein 1-like protein 1 isoform 1 n=1 Tax=Corchorus capsularis TaxID=210143 RepID=A0A1R3GV94_COCAP|nr:heat shock factor-binding protein 1-like protein 1 isoform 1 [Corchorus capsularis]
MESQQNPNVNRDRVENYLKSLKVDIKNLEASLNLREEEMPYEG